MLDEVVNEAIPAKYTEAVTAAEDAHPDRPPGHRGHRDRRRRQARVHRRGRRPPRDHAARRSTRSRSPSTTSRSPTRTSTSSWTNLRARFGTLTGVERPAANGRLRPRSTCPPRSTASAVEEATTTGFSYQVGQGGLIDGIDEAITGLSAGESATFTTTLVAGEYADRDAEVTVTVTAVKERELPEADDEFAQLASEFDTLDELTADLRERLGRVKRMEQVAQARDKVLDALRRRHRGAAAGERRRPPRSRRRTHDAVHGFDHDEDKFAEFLEPQGQTREEFDAETREDAEKSVRTRLVLDALADAEQVSVNDEELTERIIYQAQQYRMPPEEFVQRIQEAGQLGAIYADVRRSKALIAAVRAATVTDASGDAGRPVGPARRRRPTPRRGRRRPRSRRRRRRRATTRRPSRGRRRGQRRAARPGSRPRTS